MGQGGYSENIDRFKTTARGLFRVSGRDLAISGFTISRFARGWAPEQSVDVGHGERPHFAGRMTPAQIGQLSAGIRAKAGAGALRLERLVTPQTAPLEPSFTRHAPAIA
jgi:hypothetical protein